jgi:hypothetical protein
MAFAINNVHEARTRRKRLVQFSEMLMRNEDLQFLQEVETGGINEAEFVLAVLQHFEIISEDDVTPWKMVIRFHKTFLYFVFVIISVIFFSILEIQSISWE